MGLIKKILGALGIIILVWIAYIGYSITTFTPRISGEWGYVDENTTELWIKLHLGKPLPISARVEQLDIIWSGIEVGRGRNLRIGFLSDMGEGAIIIDNKKLVEALKKHIENGEKSEIQIRIRGSVFGVSLLSKGFSKPIETDILSYVDNISINAESNKGFVKIPIVERISSKWGKIEGDKITILSNVKIYNPNSFPLPLFGAIYEMEMNGYHIGTGKLAENVIIPAKGRATAKVETIVNASLLPSVWAEHVKRGEESNLRIKLYIKTRIGDKEIAIKIAEVEKTVTTDIIGQINSALGEATK